jgi:hypothetical protein
MPLLLDHAYWTFYILIVKRKYFTLASANKIIKQAPATMWSDGASYLYHLLPLIPLLCRCFRCYNSCHYYSCCIYAASYIAGIAPRPLHANITTGTKGSRPRKGGKTRYTAMQMMKFARARHDPHCAISHSAPLNMHLAAHHPMYLTGISLCICMPAISVCIMLYI